MQKETIVAAIIGLLAGVIIAGFVAGQAVNNRNTDMMRMMGMNTDMLKSGDHAMSDMNAQLQGKTGDAFDKAFLELMIDHHQDAINMAHSAKADAKHDELKTLADDIIKAQSNEITQMKTWQTQWGYGQANQHMNMGH